MYAVCVTFRLKPGTSETFMPLMLDQARNSLALEQECHRFDVCASDDGQTVFLYELYTDAAAFDPSFAVRPLRTLRRYRQTHDRRQGRQHLQLGFVYKLKVDRTCAQASSKCDRKAASAASGLRCLIPS